MIKIKALYKETSLHRQMWSGKRKLYQVQVGLFERLQLVVGVVF